MEIDDILRAAAFGIENMDKSSPQVMGEAIVEGLRRKQAELEQLTADVAEIEAELNGKRQKVSDINAEIERRRARIDALEQVEEGR